MKSLLVLISCFLLLPLASAQDTLWAVFAKSGAEELQKDNHKEAAKLLEKAVAEIERGMVRNASTVEARTNLGRTYRALGRYGDSVSALASACEDARLGVPLGDKLAIEASYQLCETYVARGQDAKAQPFLEWLISLKSSQEFRDRGDDIYDMLANIHIRAKRYEEAFKTYEEVVVLISNVRSYTNITRGRQQEKIAALWLLRDQPEKAANRYLDAVREYIKDPSREDAFYRNDVSAYLNAAKSFAKANDKKGENDAYARAEKRLQETIEFWSNKGGPTSGSAIRTGEYLADYYEKREKFGKAEAALKAILEIWVDKKGAGCEEAADAEMQIGAFHSRRKNPAEAEKWFRTALENRETAVGKESPELAACINRLAGFLSDNGKHQDAEKLLRRNVANCRAGGDAASKPLAAALARLGSQLCWRFQPNEGFTCYKEALSLYEKLDGVSSRSVADVLDDMAWKSPDYSLRLPLATRAKEIIAATGYKNWRYIKAVNTVGMANSLAGKHADAESCFRECIALDQDREPNHLIKPHLHNNIAVTFSSRSRFPEAEKDYLDSIAGQEKANDGPLSLAKTQSNLAGLYQQWYREKDAERYLLKALELRERHDGKEGSLAALSLGQLAALEARRGSFALAEGLFERTEAIRKPEVVSNEHEAEIANSFELAWRHHHHGRWKLAEDELAKLLKTAGNYSVDQPLDVIWSGVLGKYSSAIHDVYALRGEVARQRGDITAAETEFRRHLEIMERFYPETHFHAASLLKLARCDLDRKEYKSATERTQRAVKWLDKIFGEDHPATGYALQLLAEISLAQGKPDAREELAQVLKIREKDPTAKPNLLWTKVLLAQADMQFGKTPEATLKTVEGLLVECREMYGDKHFRQHEILALQAGLLAKTNKPAEAAKRWKETLTIRESLFGKDHKLTKDARTASESLAK